jgi:CsoR family transcriptional regulator, copper-sensing transcriptional repressor
MLNEEDKGKLTNRLQRVSGQVAAIQRMIANDVYCVDILMQIAAASGALGKVGQLVMENHFKTCVAETMKSENDRLRERKLEELVEIFRRYSRLGH